MTLTNNDLDELYQTLKLCHIDRIHIHHLLGREEIARRLIDELATPFDITVHDYYLICPQIHLHRPNSAHYCGEPGEEQCNRCIAGLYPFGSRDIRSWRAGHAWFVENAQRVICPSRDVKDRIAKYYPRANLVLAPHEPNLSGSWTVEARPLSVDQPLRIALIGHLTTHKGREIVEACLQQSNQTQFQFILIGAAQPPFRADIGVGFLETGVYKEAELAARLEKLAPHVVWFPQPIPETYSYTLTAAIDSGLPIAATRIGALPERLDGRPLTWLVDASTAPPQWLAMFESLREQLLTAPPSPQTGRRAKSEPFYPAGYLSFERACSTLVCPQLSVAAPPRARHTTGGG